MMETTTPDIRYEGSNTMAGRRVLNRARVSGVVLSATAINRQEVSELPRSNTKQQRTSTGTNRTYATQTATSADQHQLSMNIEPDKAGCGPALDYEHFEDGDDVVGGDRVIDLDT